MEPKEKIDQWAAWVNAGYEGDVLVPLPPGRKGPAIHGWQDASWSRGELRGFAKAGNDLGLRTRSFPTLDVDTDNEEVTEAVRSVLSGGGFWPCMIRSRTGSKGSQPNRFAAIFRLGGGADPFTKMVQTYQLIDPETGEIEETFRLEFLGDGQQVKVVGPHDTPEGGVYQVEEPRGSVRASSELSGLDETGAKELLEEIHEELVERLGEDRVSLVRKARSGGGAGGSAGGGGGSRHVPGGGPGGATVLGPDNAVPEDELRELVMEGMVPNVADEFETREALVGVAGAIWSASGGTEWGFDLFHEWACSPRGDYEHNTEDYLRHIWDSFAVNGTDNTIKELRNRYAGELNGVVGRRYAARSAFRQLARQGYGLADAGADQGIEVWSSDDERVLIEQNTLAGAASGITSNGLGDRDPRDLAPLWVTRGKTPRLREFGSLTDAAAQGMVLRTSDLTMFERATGTPMGGRGFTNAASFLSAQFADAPELKYTVPGKKPGDPPVEKTEPLSKWLERNADIPRVHELGYYPGAPEFLIEHDTGAVIWNRWRAVPEVREALMAGAASLGVAGDEIERSDFGELTSALFESTGEDAWEEHWRRFLDCAAVVICQPSVKPGHHYLFTGGQGIGKSLTAEVITQLVGPANRGDVNGSTLSLDYNNFLQSRFIAIDELYVVSGNTSSGGASAYNALKSYLAKTPSVLSVNRKMDRMEKAQNTHWWMMSSNASAGSLRIDEDDRRIAVVACDGLHGSLRARAKRAAEALGAIKDRGWGHDWLDWHARAFAARFAEVWADRARWDAVMAGPPRTNTKAAMVMEDLSPLAEFILEAWKDGLIPDVTDNREVASACSKRRNVPNAVANALATPRYVREALVELGAVAADKKVSMPQGRVRPVAMPASELGHPSGWRDADDVDAITTQDRCREWRLEWADVDPDKWVELREEAMARFEN